MNLDRVTSGKDIPDDINVIIEIRSHGDPVDVLVVTPVPLISGSVIRCRPIGMLKMTDDPGPDGKLPPVPVDKLCMLYRQTKKPEDMPGLLLAQIAHFFEHCQGPGTERVGEGGRPAGPGRSRVRGRGRHRSPPERQGQAVLPTLDPAAAARRLRSSPGRGRIRP